MNGGFESKRSIEARVLKLEQENRMLRKKLAKRMMKPRRIKKP